MKTYILIGFIIGILVSEVKTYYSYHHRTGVYYDDIYQPFLEV